MTEPNVKISRLDEGDFLIVFKQDGVTYTDRLLYRLRHKDKFKADLDRLIDELKVTYFSGDDK